MDKIIGLGNALVDVLALLDGDEVLAKMQLPKGSMTLIDADKLAIINAYFNGMNTHMATGGSAGNVIHALACLGADTGFVGKIGRDAYGSFFQKNLQEHHIEAQLMISSELPSGVASTFISPDGERTFGTYLGAAASLQADELRPEMFRGYAYLFVEGYLVQDYALISRAMELAKAEGLKICLDMASYNVVAADHTFFYSLVERYVDIIFANEEEARAFTGKEPEEALSVIGKMCEIAVVKVGPRGSYVCRGTEKLHVEALPVDRVVDTTGAGDYFAGGFLYGLISGCSLVECAKIGTLTSGRVIQVVGAELPAEQWEEIRKEITLL